MFFLSFVDRRREGYLPRKVNKDSSNGDINNERASTNGFATLPIGCWLMCWCCVSCIERVLCEKACILIRWCVCIGFILR